MPKKHTQQQFIDISNKIHNNKYDYSKSVYVNSTSKITIICKDHGEFLQQANSHLRGVGCPSCAKCKRLTTEEFIRRSNIAHDNKFDYTKSIYKDTDSKVIITCPTHGDFEQNTKHHMNGVGCAKCYGNHRITSKEFIEKAKKVHGNTYDYSKVDYVNNRIKIFITCQYHGDFKQIPKDHLRGKGCKQCSDTLNCRNYLKRSNTKKRNSPETIFKTYLLKCTLPTGETFLKFGNTWNTVLYRYGTSNIISKRSPFNWEILDIIKTKDNKKVVYIENYLKQILIENEEYIYSFRDLSDYQFEGYTECFKYEYKDMLLNLFEGFKKEVNLC